MLQAAAGPAAPDSVLERLKTKAEACIQANAAAVERNDPNLTDAATFLTDDLCANEVEVFGQYRSNLAVLENTRNVERFMNADNSANTPQMKAMIKQQVAAYQSARIDPDTGEIVYPPDSPMAASRGWTIVPASPAAPEFRELAARALLQARQSRLGQ